MANPSPHLLDSHRSLVLSFSDFFAAAVHLILFQREVYPQNSFMRARKYNFPVWQNRHPGVCKWVSDAVAAVEAQALKGAVARTSLIILSKEQVPLERYVFSIEGFPAIKPEDSAARFRKEGDPEEVDLPLTDDEQHEPMDQEDYVTEQESSADSEFEDSSDPGDGGGQSRQSTPSPEVPQRSTHASVSDLAVQFAGCFAALVAATETLVPLSKGATFTIVIELRRDLTHSMRVSDTKGKWIPSGSARQVPGAMDEANGSSAGLLPAVTTLVQQEQPSMPDTKQRDKKTVPLRTVVAEPFFLEAWLEHAAFHDAAEHPPRPPRRHHQPIEVEYDDLRS